MKKITVEIELMDYVYNILKENDFEWNEEFKLCALEHAYKIKEIIERRRQKENKQSSFML